MKPTDLLPLLTSLLFILSTRDAQGLIRPQHDKVVACYVASWAAYRPDGGKFLLDDLRPEHCTHIIYAFAGLNVTSWTIRSLDPWADLEKDGIGNYRKLTSLRRRYPGLKISLGIGGWNEGSANYSALASSPGRRKTFISSVIEYLRLYDFNGLDLDWEFPGKRGGAPYDKENFVSLVKELKETFRSYNFILTAAISADKATIDAAYDIPEISKYLDYIHIMAYDYHGAWNKQVLPNAPLKNKNGPSVEDTVMHLLHRKAPVNKLVLGIPMYGRTFILTTKPQSSEESPIGLPSLDKGFAGPYTREDGFLGYNEICKELTDKSQNWRTGWDEYSHTPYAVRDDYVIVYDNAKSISAKIDYISKENFAGVMIWSIDTDDFRGIYSSYHSEILDLRSDATFPLMRFINMALRKASNDVDSDNTVNSNEIATDSTSLRTDVNIFLTISLILVPLCSFII